MNRIRRTSKSQNQPAVPPTPADPSPTAAPENGTEAEYVAAEQQPQDTLADIAPEGVVSPDELAPASASATEPSADLETQPPFDIVPSTDADMGGDIEAPVPVALTEMEDGGATPQAGIPDTEALGEQSPADVTSAAPVAEADAAAAVAEEAPDTNPDLDTSPQLGAVEREERGARHHRDDARVFRARVGQTVALGDVEPERRELGYGVVKARGVMFQLAPRFEARDGL